MTDPTPTPDPTPTTETESEPKGEPKETDWTAEAKKWERRAKENKALQPDARSNSG